ncbi:MAG: fumarylacetoacetate hydrolase family protein [Lachnospiraceae bacterium]|nr:fumarylacetoacetate hydrolase family protein [Lachnospiraceae bacterium]
MKLLTYRYHGCEAVGVLSSDKDHVIPISAWGLRYPTMLDFLSRASDSEKQLLQCEDGRDISRIPIRDISFLAPIPCPAQDIICLGINYMEHAEESARYSNETFGGDRPFAVYFSKRTAECVGHEQPIEGHFDLTERLDYEAELAVVIGKDCKNVSEEDAHRYIFGYTILNDVSARELQTRHKQWYFGKSLDGFTPAGPWIVTKDEFSFPPALKIQSRVNGELRQDSNTSQLIFGIPHMISELSSGMTLKAGTIIATGTPAGAGMGFDPPKFLKKGDIVECTIEGIGTLRNPVGD